MRTREVSSSRRTRRGLHAAAVAGFGALIVALPLGAGATPEPVQSDAVLVHRQAYVTNAPVDPYSGDPTTIHAGVRGGEELARAFVRLDFDALPGGALIGKTTLTLRITQSAEASSNTVYQTHNVNHEAALLQACVLTSELSADFDAANPPGHDCLHGSAAGVRGAGDAWHFDLTNLVKAWSKAGNTGAAILPIPSGGPSDTWAISFYKARAEAEAFYTLPPAPPPPSAPGKPAFVPIPKVIPAPYPFPTAPPAAVPPPAAAPAPVAPPAVVTTSVPGEPSTAWRWVLPACIAAALGVLVFSRRRGVASVTGPTLARIRADLGRRPRAYVLTAVVAAWGVLFASYSLVVPPPSRLISSQGPATSPDGAAPPSGPTTPGTQPPAGPVGVTVTPGGPGRASGTPGTPGNSGAPAAGVVRRVGYIDVFYPADGSAPIARLYSGADDTRGIDFANRTISLCGHAAMTYGPVFDITEEDLVVFFRWLNDRGGAGGWKLKMDLIDDGYDPGKAVQAAQTCKDAEAFMILGGIGFDQIPAVRQWAEQNRELYLHHIVTTAGSRGLKYSFTALPSEEQMGRWAGELAVRKFAGKKVGILWRQSPNWQSGHDLFLQTVKGKLTIVGDRPVQKNQGNYTQDVAALRDADVIFAWENALGTVEMIQAAQAQQMHPAWIVFPFNLQTYALGDAADDQPLYGIGAWDAYTFGERGGPYSSYAADIAEFEEAYRRYKPDADLSGPGGDILFLTWQAYKQLADIIARCGTACTRNKMAAAMLDYSAKLGGACPVDFTRGDRHHGGWTANVFAVQTIKGKPAWIAERRCVERV